MKLTNQQVLQYYREEQFELVFATQEQIDWAVKQLGCDNIQRRWDDYQEEMNCLVEEARIEFQD